MNICSRTIGYCFPIVFWKHNSETGYWNANFFHKQAVEILKNGQISVMLHSSAPSPDFIVKITVSNQASLQIFDWFKNRLQIFDWLKTVQKDR